MSEQTFVEHQLTEIAKRLVLGQPWYPNTEYHGIKKLSQNLSKTYGTINKCTVKAVYESDGLLRELVVSSIHSQHVTVEIPNGKGGHSYPRLSYEHIEYPPHSMAARGVAANEAQALYPIDDKMGKSKKDKQETLRRTYVATHWQDHYDNIVIGIRDWHERQKRPVPVYENVHRQLIQNTDRVYRWVLKFEIKWDDKRTIVLDTYDEAAAMIVEMQKKFRSFELTNWSLTYEIVTQYRMLLNVKPIK